jgi:O-antigen/teichoic acid export membrane protein
MSISEKTFGSPQPATAQQNIVTVIKGSGIKISGLLFENVMRFALGVILARWMGAEQYGLYNLGTSTFYVINGLAMLGFSPAVIRYVSIYNSRRDEAGVRGVIQVGLSIPLTIAVIIGMALVVFADAIAWFFFEEPALAPILKIVGWSIPINIFIAVLTSVMEGFKEFKKNAIAQFFLQSLTKLLLTVALAFTGLTALKAMVAHSLSVVIVALVFIYLVHQIFPLNKSWGAARRNFKEMFRFSLPIYGSNLLHLLGGQLQTLLVGALGSVTGVGIFVVASRVNILGEVVHQGINTTTMPIVSELYDRGDRQQLGHFYQLITKWIFAFNLPNFLIILLFSRPLLSIFGEEFTTGSLVLIILACSSLVDAATGINSVMISMSGNTWLNTVNSAVILILRLSLAFILIPQYGAVGAAIGLASTSIVLNIMRTVEVFMLARLWPYDRNFVKPILAGLAAAAVGGGLSYYVLPGANLVNAIINSIFLMITYVAVTVALGLSVEDKLILGRLRQRYLRLWSKRQKKTEQKDDYQSQV